MWRAEGGLLLQLSYFIWQASVVEIVSPLKPMFTDAVIMAAWMVGCPMLTIKRVAQNYHEIPLIKWKLVYILIIAIFFPFVHQQHWFVRQQFILLNPWWFFLTYLLMFQFILRRTNTLLSNHLPPKVSCLSITLILLKMRLKFLLLWEKWLAFFQLKVFVVLDIKLFNFFVR